ncbi:hypothetical protein [Scytonema sp. PCC 10023]|uniref:hypothetical protein n=1 Tax=Scytonema sp. PCC 10023 TaxID=1680591 RepID=UPI0039C7201C
MRNRIPGAVSVTWIEDVRIKKGENLPFWLSRVEAQFPTDIGEEGVAIVALGRAVIPFFQLTSISASYKGVKQL